MVRRIWLTLSWTGGDLSEALCIFRLAVFNVAAVNEDDHLKDVAFLLDSEGPWRVSPAFDLTYAPRPFGERCTTVASVRRQVSRVHLLTLAERAGIKASVARRVIDEVTAATVDVGRHLAAAGCEGPVSRAAATAVMAATVRVRGA